jgi:hypothetical protein
MRNLLATVVFSTLALPAFAGDDTFAIAHTEAKGAVGAKATASVTITARKGWHLNQEAPLTLKLAPAAGVTVDKPKLARADLAVSTELQARFDVPLTLAEAGRKTVEAEASFVLCQQDSCRPIKEKLTLAAEATAPAAPAAPAKKAKKAKKKS